MQVDGHVVGEGEVCHVDEPVAETDGGDGAVEEQSDGDDGLEGLVFFNVDEDEEED